MKVDRHSKPVSEAVTMQHLALDFRRSGRQDERRTWSQKIGLCSGSLGLFCPRHP